MSAPVYFLPGMHGSGQLWTQFRQVWSSSFSSVSYPAHPEAVLDDLCAVVEAAIATEHPEGLAVDLVAESFSGPVALRVAQRQRVQVRKLVLVASFAGAWPSWMLSAIQVLPVRKLAWLPMPTICVTRMLLNGIDDRALIDEVIAVVRSIAPQVIAGRLQLLAGLVIGPWRCHCPVLALQATHDRLLGQGAVCSIRKVCTDLNLVEIEGPHLLMQSRPRQCATAIGAFLERKIPR